jgi:hypothetical protein
MPVPGQLIETDEKIPGKQGLGHCLDRPMPELLDRQHRQIAGEPLALEILERAPLLLGLALDDVPLSHD